MAHVTETMRPLALDALPNLPGFVEGLAVVRGGTIPVVHLGRLLGDASAGNVTRWITLEAGEGTFAVSVDAVLGIRRLAAADLAELPPLLRVVDTEVVEAIGLLDSRVVLVLDHARIVPDDMWVSLKRAEVSA